MQEIEQRRSSSREGWVRVNKNKEKVYFYFLISAFSLGEKESMF